MSGCRSPTAPNGSAGCAANRFCFSPENKLQIPNPKLQRSTKFQAQKPACAPFAPCSVFGVWGLRFGISMELGVWCLVFRSAWVCAKTHTRHSVESPYSESHLIQTCGGFSVEKPHVKINS